MQLLGVLLHSTDLCVKIIQNEEHVGNRHVPLHQEVSTVHHIPSPHSRQDTQQHPHCRPREQGKGFRARAGTQQI